MRTLLSIVIFLLPFFALAQDNVIQKNECGSHGSHSEERACYIAENAKSEQMLGNAEASTLSALHRWDEDAHFKSRSIAAFKNTTTNFRQMRKINCEFQATLAAGGNGAGDMRLDCQIELNQRRIIELQKTTASLQRP